MRNQFSKKMLADGKNNYDMMKRWMDYVESKAGESLCEWGTLFHFGDWLIASIMAQTHNPMLTALRTKEETALAYLIHTANCMAEIAAVLERADDAEHYLDLTRRAREVFSKTYVSPDGKMREPLQGLYVLALAEHTLNPEQKKGAVRELGCCFAGRNPDKLLLQSFCIRLCRRFYLSENRRTADRRTGL